MKAKKNINIVLGTISVISFIILLLTIRRDISVIGLIVFISVIILLLIINLRKRFLNLRKDKRIGDIKNIESHATQYNITKASDGDIDWVAELEKFVYSGIDVMPLQILKEWYSISQNSFFIIKDNKNNRVGHITILPLRETTLNLFIDGEIIEQQIRGDSLYPGESKKDIKNLYIESVAIPYISNFQKSKALVTLLQSIDFMIKELCCAENSINIFAMPASKAGTSLMKSLGFTSKVNRNRRKDGYDMFKIQYSDLRENILRKFPE